MSSTNAVDGGSIGVAGIATSGNNSSSTTTGNVNPVIPSSSSSGNWWTSSNSWFAWLWEGQSDISDEKMEEYRMLSNFKPREINRLYRYFNEVTENSPTLSKDKFLLLPAIHHNLLKSRIAMCFGYDDDHYSLTFQEFLIGVALFNAPGQREQKLKTAFRIQDFDNDGVINKQDLIQYLHCITDKTLNDKELEAIAINVLRESSSDPNQQSLSFADFRRIVTPLDFQAKLLLPI